MDSRQLQHMYQAWQQGNDHHVRDWLSFVEYAARIHGTTPDAVMRVLQTTYWFNTPKEDK
jgi:hypothetical protein